MTPKGYFIYYDNEIVVNNLMGLADAFVAITIRVGQGHRKHPHIIYSEYGIVMTVDSAQIEAMHR